MSNINQEHCTQTNIQLLYTNIYAEQYTNVHIHYPNPIQEIENWLIKISKS